MGAPQHPVPLPVHAMQRARSQPNLAELPMNAEPALLGASLRASGPGLLLANGNDAFGRSDMILGYGAVHLPMTPGRHELYVNTFRPLASSLMGRFQSWLNGMRPEFIDSLFPSKAQGRDVTRVQSFGTVKLVLDVTLQGMETLGYATVSQQTAVRLSSPFAAR